MNDLGRIIAIISNDSLLLLLDGIRLLLLLHHIKQARRCRLASKQSCRSICGAIISIIVSIIIAIIH